MSRSELVFNDEVFVEKRRAIAARGITPNHVHAEAWVEARGIKGVLGAFKHMEKTTQLLIFTFPQAQRVYVEVPHLEEILIES